MKHKNNNFNSALYTGGLTAATLMSMITLTTCAVLGFGINILKDKNAQNTIICLSLLQGLSVCAHVLWMNNKHQQQKIKILTIVGDKYLLK